VNDVENIGHFKAGKKDRIGSKKHKQSELYFLNESVDGKVPLGWIMPMLGAFRANVIWNDPRGSFAWKVPNERLLKSCLRRLVSCILEIHQRENSRPEYVGRSATAWRLCYETVENAILQEELQKGPRNSKTRSFQLKLNEAAEHYLESVIAHAASLIISGKTKVGTLLWSEHAAIMEALRFARSGIVR
jgi:hypothetical protein